MKALRASFVLDRRGIWALLFVAAFAALVLGYYHDRFWWPADDGAYAHVADRILGGEVLNRDVQDIHPGYVNFANALALRLFGDDLVSLRYPLAAMSFLQSCLIVLLLAQRGALVAAAAGVSMTALSLVQYLSPTANWYCLFLLIALICTLAWRPRESRWRLEIVGFLIVAIVLFRQLTGVIVGIGVLTFLLCEAPRGAGPGQRWLARALIAVMAGGLGAYLLAKTDLAALIMFGCWPLAILLWTWLKAAVPNRHVLGMLLRLSLGGIVALAPLLLYHTVHGSLGDWFDDSVISALSLSRLGFIGDESFLLLPIQGLRQVVAPTSAAGMLNGLFWTVLALLAAALGVMVLRALARGDEGGSAPHPLPFLATFHALVSLHYQIPIYLFYTVGLTLAGLLWMASASPSWRKGGTVALACALSAVGLYYHAAQPISRTLGGTLLGQRIALVPSDGLERSRLWVEADDVELYSALVDLVQRETPPGETILALPVNPELYYLSRRRNPFRFFSSALGIRNQAELDSALRTLESSPPKLVFHQPADKYNTAYSEAIMEFVKRHYERLESRGEFDIYRYPGRPR